MSLYSTACQTIGTARQLGSTVSSYVLDSSLLIWDESLDLYCTMESWTGNNGQSTQLKLLSSDSAWPSNRRHDANQHAY